MPTHFVLRVPLMTRVQARSFNTIDAHNQVIEKIGKVALGKFGKSGTVARTEMFNAQIGQGVETLLILVVKRDDKFLGYQSPVLSVHHGDPGEIRELAPPYYANL